MTLVHSVYIATKENKTQTYAKALAHMEEEYF